MGLDETGWDGKKYGGTGWNGKGHNTMARIGMG